LKTAPRHAKDIALVRAPKAVPKIALNFGAKGIALVLVQKVAQKVARKRGRGIVLVHVKQGASVRRCEKSAVRSVVKAKPAPSAKRTLRSKYSRSVNKVVSLS
jgi:hypothetical protein